MAVDIDEVTLNPDDLYRSREFEDIVVFIFLPPNHLFSAKSNYINHYELFAEHREEFQKLLGDRAPAAVAGDRLALQGRAGIAEGVLCVAFWNQTDPSLYRYLQPCLRNLCAAYPEYEGYDIHVYSPLGNSIHKSDQVETRANRQTAEDWELLRKLHLLRGKEKQAALKKLNLAHKDIAQHPMARGLQRAGLLGPGQKWWAPQSESRSFCRLLGEALEKALPSYLNPDMICLGEKFTKQVPFIFILPDYWFCGERKDFHSDIWLDQRQAIAAAAGISSKGVESAYHDTKDNSIWGRAGFHGDQAVLALWSDPTAQDLQRCLQHLRRNHEDYRHVPIYVYSKRLVGDCWLPRGRRQQSRATPVIPETDWELLRKLHLLRGKQKQQALKRLGLGWRTPAEHPVARYMRRVGLLGPGQKWWALQSESTRITADQPAANKETVMPKVRKVGPGAMQLEHQIDDVLAKALRLSKTVGAQPSTIAAFRPGTKVTILNPEFRGELGIVTGSDTNLFGQILVNVMRVDEDDNPISGIATCFYPGELRIRSETN
jgi:hypothetical protein